MVVRSKFYDQLEPVVYGGGATADVIDGETYIHKTGYLGHEVGTLNTAGIIGMGEGIKYFNKLVKDGLWEHEKEVASYAFDKLSQIDNVKFYSKRGDTNVMFNIEGYGSQDVVSFLGYRNIFLRSGSHCAKMLHCNIHDKATIRLSIAGYNSKEDIDIAYEAIIEGMEGDFLEFI